MTISRVDQSERVRPHLLISNSILCSLRMNNRLDLTVSLIIHFKIPLTRQPQGQEIQVDNAALGLVQLV